MTYAPKTILLTAGFLLGAGGCSGTDGGGEAKPLAKLFINELQPSNQDTFTDENNEADDWIEIFNAGDGPTDMLGFSLADSSGTTQTIPGQVIVAPGAFHLFWADDTPGQGPSHLGFKLSAKAGDSITLKDGSGRTLDTASFGPVADQSSYARFPDGTGPFAWCRTSTPGKANGAACLAP
jgi:hypothetical protein